MILFMMGLPMMVIGIVTAISERMKAKNQDNPRLAKEEAKAKTNEELMEQFEALKKKYEYEEGCYNIAVAGSTAAGKSSLVNSFRGLRDRDTGAAPVGRRKALDPEKCNKTTKYPDPTSKKLVWYDVPGQGTIDNPTIPWEDLAIFDAILIVCSNTIMDSDYQLLRKCRKAQIPTFVVRSRTDAYINQMMQDDGGEKLDPENEDDWDVCREAVMDEADRVSEEVGEKLEEPEFKFYLVSKMGLWAVTRKDEDALAEQDRYIVDEEDLITDLVQELNKLSV